jgi:hypothetical protein
LINGSIAEYISVGGIELADQGKLLIGLNIKISCLENIDLSNIPFL